ncbi:flagellar assembly protein T N-terminal domain-containing protein [Gallaecimonas sp. GXIMD4217]|uniref:flagellar assembly protein T N-terminal domain-containing protein n=1 Tax=Gallaecimonas sp. GXIMD4217 TaxID=3131927 RepID=UPI00311AC857
MKRHLAPLLLLCCALPALADWFQVTGKAPLGGELAQVRQAAMEDALRQAVFYSGLNIDVRQVLTNGRLEDNSLSIHSQGQVQQMELVSERSENGQLWVTLLVDLDLTASQCQSSQGISLHRFSWRSPLDRPAHIQGDFGMGVAEQLGRLLQDREGLLVPAGQVGASLYRQGLPDADTLQRLASQRQVRYLLGGRLLTLEHQQQRAPWFAPWQPDGHSYRLGMQLWLLDSFSGQALFERRYEVSALLDDQAPLDMDSPALWQSAFGQSLNQLLMTAVTELEAQLNCPEQQWPVLALEDDMALIGAGLRHGVGQGDRFLALHKRTLVTQSGERRQVLQPSSLIFEVSQAEADQASLQAQGAIPGQLNIQIGDYLRKQ